MDPFLGEIRIFTGNYAPQGWMFCNGQALDVSENDALYSLIGTTYGGDGTVSFNLPDLRGRTPIHAGKGVGLSPRAAGDMVGSETVTLTQDQLPAHYHPVHAVQAIGTLSSPAGAIWAQASTGEKQYSDGASSVGMSAACTTTAGGGLPHDNLMPYQVVSFIIAIAGIYPQLDPTEAAHV